MRRSVEADTLPGAGVLLEPSSRCSLGGKGGAKFEYHLFALSAQIVIGTGAVVGKLGLTSFNPLLFAFMREAGVVPILFGIHWYLWREVPRLPLHLTKTFVAMGSCLFLNQACFLAGVKMSSPVTASAWQLSLPILTAAIAVAIGRERLTGRKVAAACLGTVGAFVIVVGGSGPPEMRVLSNCLFFCNCLASAGFLLVSKPVLALYPATLVTAYAYLFASVQMGLLAVLVANCPLIHNAVCPDCVSPWHVPDGALYAVLYWIVVVTAGGYSCMVFANKGLESSSVSLYTVVQPLVSCLLAVSLIQSGVNPGGVLQMPGWNLVGALGILMGLALVVTDPAAQ